MLQRMTSLRANDKKVIDAWMKMELTNNRRNARTGDLSDINESLLKPFQKGRISEQDRTIEKL